MPRKQKLSPEAKVKLAQACLSGEIGVCEAGRQSGVSPESVRRWIARYESEGAEGFLPQGTNRVYSTELKLNAVRDYLMSTEQTPVFFAAPKYPAMLSKLAKGRTESYGDSARGPTWQSHEQRFPAALQ